MAHVIIGLKTVFTHLRTSRRPDLSPGPKDSLTTSKREERAETCEVKQSHGRGDRAYNEDIYMCVRIYIHIYIYNTYTFIYIYIHIYIYQENGIHCYSLPSINIHYLSMSIHYIRSHPSYPLLSMTAPPKLNMEHR